MLDSSVALRSELSLTVLVFSEDTKKFDPSV